MKRNFKFNLFVYFLTIVLCMMPIMAVSAAEPKKGDVDNTPVTAGSTTNPGDVQIEKSVTPVAGEEGKYHISFTVKGKDAKKQVNVYAAVVFDRSGSMICGIGTRERGWPYYDTVEEQTYSEISETHWLSPDDPKHFTAEDGTSIYCSGDNGANITGLTDGKWNSAVNGAKSFSNTLLSNLPGNSYVSLVSFAGSANPATNWSQSAFNGSDFGHPYGNTNLADGINTAQSKLASVNDPNAVKVMVVISDGEPNSGNPYATAASDAKRAGTIIYAIGYETNAAADAALTSVASQGNYYKADEASVNAALQNMAEELSKTYAGTNATISDGIESEFTYEGNGNFVQDPNNPQEVTCNIGNITEEGTTCGFDVTIDPNVETGWYDTNTHASITYTKLDGTTGTVTLPSSPKVYWEQAKYNYVVNYYKDEITNTDDTENFLGSSNGGPIEYGTVIGENDIEKNLFLPEKGYKFESTSPSSITISDNESANVINVLYTKKNDLSYKVEHYYNENNKENISDYILDKNATVTKTNQTFGDQILEPQVGLKEKDGYTKKEIVGTPLTIDDDETKNIICVYYDRRHDLSYKVRYLEKDSETVLHGEKTVANQTFGTTVSEDYVPVTGYKLVSSTPQTLTIGTNEDKNVITFYYEKRNDLSYTVKYLENGTNKKLADEKTVSNNTYGEEVSEDAADITGYKLVSSTPQKLTIGAKESENVITFYYEKRDDIGYTINYHMDSINEDPFDHESGEATFGDTKTVSADQINAKLPDGYEYSASDSNIQVTISANEDENVMDVVYVKRTDLTYCVHYYYDTILDEDATETYENQTFGDEVSDYIPKLKDGYRFDSDTAPITIGTGKNIIDVYYVKRTDLSYVVRYLEEGTKKVLKTEKTVPNQKFEDTVTEEAADITGYELVSPEEQSLTISFDNSKNVITFFYKKRSDLSYTVKYLEKGTKTPLADEKTVGEKTYGDEVTENAINIDGYYLAEDEASSKTITIDVENNEIIFYYEKRSDIGYTINYHMNSIDEAPFTSENGKATFGETKTVSADQINANLPDGYKYSVGDSNINVTISANEDENVMDVVYVKRTDLTYCVHYYYDNILDESATETYKNQTFGDEVSDYTQKLKDGYKFDRDTAPITIGTTENIIDVYYSKRTDIPYTVRYLEEGTDNYLAPEKNVPNNTFESEVTEKAIDINGYELVSEEEQSLTISAKEAENVITFYYKKRTDLTYDVYYIDRETGDFVKDPKHEEGQTFGDIVTETAPNIPGYVLAEDQDLRADIRITSNNHENYAIFLYEKRKDLSYTVKYLEKGTNKKLADEKIVNNQTYLDEITEKAISINGYKLVGKDSQTITIQVEGNEIIFYYEQEPQPEYVEPPKTGITETGNKGNILMLIVTFIISLFGIRLETKKN